ncbi:MAG: outer membrane protein transport protein [Burkholderiales bacterium]
MKLKGVAAALAVMGIALPAAALATDGYFSHGYGMKAKGMGGASTAVAQDAFGGANNPATMAFAGNQFAIGVDWFSPHRSAERAGSPAGANLNGSADSGSTNFFIPEFGLNYMVRPDLAIGLTVYGNGGMNTNYPSGQINTPSGTGTCNFFQTGGLAPAQPSYNLLCGNGNLGVDLSQLIIAPTLAWKFLEGHSIGIAPLFAYQRFKAEGLQAFAGLSATFNPATGSNPSLTNNGYDSSSGWGVRVGYYGNLTKQIQVGASYSSKISMGNLDKYSGLFAESGGFDIPSNWSLGVAFRPTQDWLVALDYMRINYSDVPSVHNQSSVILNCPPFGTNASTCLGGSNGAGFGWQSVNVFKLGAQYAVSQQWTVRAGYNYTQNPIQPQDVTFNILAPGVVQNHVTLGATWTDKQNEVTGAFMYAFDNSVTGPSLFNSFIPGATMQEEIKMYEWSFGLQYARKF